MRSEAKETGPASRSAISICSMAGAAKVMVTRCSRISRTASCGMNCGITTLTAPALKPCMNQPMPAMPKPGSEIRLTSSARQSIQSTPCSRIAAGRVKKLRWASTAPLGRPVVPLV